MPLENLFLADIVFLQHLSIKIPCPKRKSFWDLGSIRKYPIFWVVINYASCPAKKISGEAASTVSRYVFTSQYMDAISTWEKTRFFGPPWRSSALVNRKSFQPKGVSNHFTRYQWKKILDQSTGVQRWVSNSINLAGGCSSSQILYQSLNQIHPDPVLLIAETVQLSTLPPQMQARHKWRAENAR